MFLDRRLLANMLGPDNFTSGELRDTVSLFLGFKRVGRTHVPSFCSEFSLPLHLGLSCTIIQQRAIVLFPQSSALGIW